MLMTENKIEKTIGLNFTELEKVIKFLKKENWEFVKPEGNSVLYRAPAKLGLGADYTLSFPVLLAADDFQKALRKAIKSLSKAYKIEAEKLFYDVGDYMEVLKKDALYFKLKSEEVLFRHTLEIEHIWQFLRNLSLSYSNFVKVKFRQEFSALYQDDPVRMKKSLSTLLAFSKLRLVDVAFESFSFGVSVDTQMGKEQMDKAIIGFRKDLLQDFWQEVIAVNYSSAEDINAILEKYSEIERKAIFEPLIKSINKEEHSIVLTDSKFIPQYTHGKIPKSTVKALIPVKEMDRDGVKVEMMQIIVPVDRSKSKITINTREIEDGIFSQSIEEHKTRVDSVRIDGEKIKLRKTIEFTIKQDKESGEFIVTFAPLDFELKVKEFQKIKSEFFAAFISNFNYYKYIVDRRKKIEEPSEKKLVKFFKSVLPK
jgi:hypothetical protein